MITIAKSLAISVFAATLAFAGCASVNQTDTESLTLSELGKPAIGVIHEDPTTLVGERDNLYSLAALTLVNRDWQAGSETRGHNIGSILVNNATGEIVFYARNSNKILASGCQHGEVRLVTNFLKCEKAGPYLGDYTLYTTLEPCIMCAGMLTMTQIGKVVYVQQDPSYGNTQEIIGTGNYPIYYQEATVDSDFKSRLESSYNKSGVKSITKWLVGDDAYQIYNDAEQALLNYKPIFDVNNDVYDKVMKFLDKDLLERFNDAMAKQCPTGKFKKFY